MLSLTLDRQTLVTTNPRQANTPYTRFLPKTSSYFIECANINLREEFKFITFLYCELYKTVSIFFKRTPIANFQKSEFCMYDWLRDIFGPLGIIGKKNSG